jgi:hypothetical protein
MTTSGSALGTGTPFGMLLGLSTFLTQRLRNEELQNVVPVKTVIFTYLPKGATQTISNFNNAVFKVRYFPKLTETGQEAKAP